MESVMNPFSGKHWETFILNNPECDDLNKSVIDYYTKYIKKI